VINTETCHTTDDWTTTNTTTNSVTNLLTRASPNYRHYHHKLHSTVRTIAGIHYWAGCDKSTSNLAAQANSATSPPRAARQQHIVKVCCSTGCKLHSNSITSDEISSHQLSSASASEIVNHDINIAETHPCIITDTVPIRYDMIEKFNMK